jgi:predicted phosphodiesterase
MFDSYTPIIRALPRCQQEAHIYFLHDVHIGVREHKGGALEAFAKKVMDDPCAYVCVLGDIMDNAVVGSRGDVYTQTLSPHEQREAATRLLKSLHEAGKLIAVIPGNHENNRITARVGLYPLYDACVMAGCEDLYRQHFAVVDIGVGEYYKDKSKQVHYTGYLVHKAMDQKNFGTSDMLDGFDFMAFGHDHAPRDKARGKLVWDPYNKKVTRKSVECINCGSMLEYDGYAVDGGYRVPSEKMYRLELFGGERAVESHGFYL